MHYGSTPMFERPLFLLFNPDMGGTLAFILVNPNRYKSAATGGKRLSYELGLWILLWPSCFRRTTKVLVKASQRNEMF
jgi:hypothetical protein